MPPARNADDAVGYLNQLAGRPVFNRYEAERRSSFARGRDASITHVHNPPLVMADVTPR